jgi:transcriptional regulator with XRE-family HTH domain
MKVDTILRQARLTLPILAKAAQVPIGYLKQLSAGNSAPGPDTRAKLAGAFRRHAIYLNEAADQLERGE